MNSKLPERFLKHVSLRSPQLIKDYDEPEKDRFIVPPSDFKSELIEEIKKQDPKSRQEVVHIAKTIYKKNGPVDKLPAGLRNKLVQVFKQYSVTDAKNTFEALFDMSPESYLKETTVKETLYKVWNNVFCLSVATEQTAIERQKHIEMTKAFDAIIYLAKVNDDEPLCALKDIQTKRLLLPKAIFVRFKQQEQSPDVSDQETELIKNIRDLLEASKSLDSVKAKVRDETKRYYLRNSDEDLENRIFIERINIADTNKKEDAQETFELKEPENWLVNRFEDQLKANPDSRPVKRFFNHGEMDVLKNNKEFLLGNSEMDAVELMEGKLYQQAKTLLYHPRIAVSKTIANNPDANTLIKHFKLPKQKNLSIVSASSSANEERVHLLGVGDLFVLEQQVNRYEMGEVAHIENVMAKETRDRSHTRIDETENTFTTETEETVTDEKSLQTTDRFEMSKETQKQVEASFEASAGFSLSATYGPVTLGANAGIASSTSTSVAQTTSTNFAREVVEKSVTQITSRVREENVMRVLNRVEEVNQHGFINDSENNLCGIYRWIDKYYTVRNVNYGRRLMLEMIVPEPAANYLYAEQMHPEHEEIPLPPDPIDFGPDHLTRSNYMDYVAVYNATDVNAPPSEVIYKTVNIARTQDNQYTHFAEVDKNVTIDNGYRTTNFYGSTFRSWPSASSDSFIKVYVASKSLGSTDSLWGVTGNLTVSVTAKARSFNVGLRIRCELTEQAFQDWQVETWSALQTAYQAAVSDYESKVAAAAIGAGVEIHGNNPGQNEEIIRTELKRGAIRYLSENMQEIIVNGQIRNNEVFDAGDSTGNFDLNEGRVEGAIIQFFEQAFEWENMMWKFYPYFWARNSEHHDKLLAHDHDPTFHDFRRAGAARVVLPVPIVYQDAVLHFFETNEIWNGGDTPVLNEAEYISIVDDLRRGQINSFNSTIYYQDEDSVPPYIVDEWEIKLPTSLVKLQSDDQLPNFATSLNETDAETLLDNLAASNSFAAEWRNSIVNLMALLGMDSEEASRRSMAATMGYPANSDTDVINNINHWLYNFLLADINANGLPASAL